MIQSTPRSSRGFAGDWSKRACWMWEMAKWQPEPLGPTFRVKKTSPSVPCRLCMSRRTNWLRWSKDNERGESPLIQVLREKEQRVPICLAQGDEIKENLAVPLDQQTVQWQERRLLIQSMAAQAAARTSLQDRLRQAEQALAQLPVRKPGKPRLTKRREVEHQREVVI